MAVWLSASDAEALDDAVWLRAFDLSRAVRRKARSCARRLPSPAARAARAWSVGRSSSKRRHAAGGHLQPLEAQLLLDVGGAEAGMGQRVIEDRLFGRGGDAIGSGPRAPGSRSIRPSAP
jgi:hypothetical protein